ncbi:hypothetical protein FNF31_07943 [Cafeteria roenbergensis]|uniref:Meckelin n=1 Tax=Cafeteria roenbergensis TaxID=33653 RepID=A0A5A8C1T1_CAFRO|nr:hypothetical protein FNF31_07943 [Cafeteria roenbergensis]
MELSASGECSCPSGSTRVAGVEGVGADYCVPTDGLAALTTLGVAPSDASSVVFRAVELPAAASAAAATNDAPASITLSTGVVVSNPLAGLAAVSGVTSLPVRYHYPRAATGCLSWRGQASSPRCHALANLCVLALLDPAAAPCILFRLMAASREGARAGWQGWTRSLPLLQYADPAAALGSTALTQEMSFDDTVRAASEDTIRVVLASFALNGTFLGLVPMKRQLAYCGSAAPAAVALSGSTSSRTGVSDFDDPEWTRFGYGITMAVGCNLAGLLRDGSDVNSTVFYEPYFVDVASSLALSKATTDGSGLSGTSAPLSADPPLALYPMPVRIVNYRAADGGTPNADAYSPGAETGDDVLSRRFFLYDRVSGLSTASAAGTPQILRYARRLVLSMRAQDTSRAKLLVPVLTVEYRERRADDVVADTDGLGRDEVEFRVLYEAEQSQYWTAAVVMFAIGQTLAVGFAVLRMFNWNRRSVRTTEEGGLSLIVLGRFLVYLAHGYAHAAFWVAVVLCAYWFAFFKLQARVFALLPEDEPALTQDDYETLAVVLCTALAGQLLRGGELMYEQCTVDVFFVDWEKPRGELASASATVDSDRRSGDAGAGGGGDADADEEEGGSARGGAAGGDAALRSSGARGAASRASAGGAAAAGGGGPGGGRAGKGEKDKTPPVSVWRTLFMANEWSELATERRISVPLTFALLAVVLVSADQQWVATPRPNADDLSPGQVNPALQFAAAVFWFLILVLIQLVWVWAIAERFIEPSATLRFVDLCTVAKISIVLLDERYHGFYLHCDAPYDFADADMSQLVLSLSDEAGTVRAGRGLIGAPPDSGDAQAFELFLPQVWRRTFDSYYTRLDEELAARARQAGAASAAGARGGSGGQRQSALRASVDRDTAVLKHRTANAIARFIKGFVVKDQRAAGLSRVFRERSYLQRFFHTPPDIEAENQTTGQRRSADEGVSVFMLDRELRIETLIFRGVEWDLLLLALLIFSVVQFYTADPVLGAFLAILIDRVFVLVRQEWGRQNLAAKTLVDDRFLI